MTNNPYFKQDKTEVYKVCKCLLIYKLNKY